MTDAAWCEFMDLPKATCSHCAGIPDDIAISRPETKPAKLSSAVEAEHGGECACCGERYPSGTMIALTGDGWAISSHTESFKHDHEVWEDFDN